MLLKLFISILRFTIQGHSDNTWVTETLSRLYLIGIGNLYTCEITMTILNRITIKINHFYKILGPKKL